MKKILIWSGVIGAAAFVAWYFLRGQNARAEQQAAAGNPTVSSTGSAANAPSPWYQSFTTRQGLAATGAFVGSVFDGYNQLSNAFGWNDGGASGVSVSGSNHGGTQSSGSGAGVPA